MSDYIEMQRGNPRRNTANFACDLSSWRFMLEVGKAFGWRPRGAPYVELVIYGKRTLKSVPMRRDYEPGSSNDPKQLEADDALAWAKALSTARDSPHLREMVSAYLSATSSVVQVDEMSRASEAFMLTLNDFIDY